VPSDASKDQCFIVIEVNSKEITLNFSLLASLADVYWSGSARLIKTADSPTITEAKIVFQRYVNIKFSRPVIVPPVVLNLTSENDGPLFFEIKTIVDPKNLKSLQESQMKQSTEGQSRRLATANPYQMRWQVMNTTSATSLDFNLTFSTPLFVSVLAKDKINISLVYDSLFAATDNPLLALNFDPVVIDLPLQSMSESEV
jgi:hypothetical protein